jgi:hypothetical protein
MKTIFAAFLAIATTCATAQDTGRRSFPAAGFDRIKLDGCDHVTVGVGPRFAVTADGRPTSLEAIRAEVRGGILRLMRVPRTCDTRAGMPSAEIAVTLPRLRGVTIAGTGNMRLGPVDTASFDAALSGTGNLDMAGLRASYAGVDLSGTGNVTLRAVKTERLLLDLGGTGQITAEGSTGALALDAGGTGTIDTRALAAHTVSVDASGTGSVRARADATARIDASGMGRVAITGRPRCTVSKSGFARVTCG